MHANDLTAASVCELVAGIHQGEFTATEVCEAYLAQIDRLDRNIHAYVSVLGESARLTAKAIDEARSRSSSLAPLALGRLAGAPMALKDIFVTRGIATTAGSHMLKAWRPPYDGAMSQRLSQAGAVLLGKVTMDEFAMGSSNENTPSEKVHNPWAHGYVPGGSSGGSSAAVAAHMASFALGTDTGGSIRQPASFCNLVGLKPTYGRVSRFGMIAFASSFDQAGPMTRTTDDAARVLQCIAGHDPQDASSLLDPVPDYEAACARGRQQGLKNIRIGVYRADLEREGIDPEVRRTFQQALEVLQSIGVQIVDVDLPHAPYAVACYYVLSPAEAASNLARYDGVRYGHRHSANTLQTMYEMTRETGFGAEVKRRILLGTFVLRADSYDDYYGRAMRVRTLIARDYEHAFQHCDAILSPTSPMPGFKLGEHIKDPLAMYLADMFTIGANLAGLPAISIPGGFSRATSDQPALPIGMQLTGPRLGEEILFTIAAAYEHQTAWHRHIAPGVHT